MTRTAHSILAVDLRVALVGPRHDDVVVVIAVDAHSVVLLTVAESVEVDNEYVAVSDGGRVGEGGSPGQLRVDDGDAQVEGIGPPGGLEAGLVVGPRNALGGLGVNDRN